MSKQPLLLCTDLDRTLLPNGAQSESPGARRCFAELAGHDFVTLAYVSGRHRKLVEKAIANYRLPVPDYVISDVGTNIYQVRDGQWSLWPRWHDEIAPDWQGLDNAEMRRLLAGIEQLRPQEHSKQNTYKLSFYVPMHADIGSLERKLAQRLDDRGVRANLVWSIDEPAGVGLLDVLPRRASKLHAVEFLQQFLGLSKQQILFAGDSGNDLPVLVSDVPAVLVANALPALKEEALRLAEGNDTRAQLYLAQGGYLGMNGNYSAGILEGVQHYRPDLSPLIEGCLARAEA